MDVICINSNGGGIYAYSGTNTLTNNTLSGNADIQNIGATNTVSYCLTQQNSAYSRKTLKSS